LKKQEMEDYVSAPKKEDEEEKEWNVISHSLFIEVMMLKLMFLYKYFLKNMKESNCP
jgi:hypothetical protein